MPEVICQRCKIRYDIERDVIHKSERTRCTENACTRVFHHVGQKGIIKLYQTPDDVSMTVIGSVERKKQGLSVDNGGVQE